MPYLSQPLFLLPCFDRYDDRHALLDVEDVLVGLAFGRDFFLLGVAVQVEDMNAVEGVQQVPAHSPEGWVVEVAMVRDETKDALTVLLDQAF